MNHYRLIRGGWRVLALASLSFASAENAPLPDALWLTYRRSVPTHLVVNWASDTPQHSIVRFGTTQACEMQSLLPHLQTLHQVEIPLPPEGPFYYRLNINGTLTEAVPFQGLPADFSAARFRLEVAF